MLHQLTLLVYGPLRRLDTLHQFLLRHTLYILSVVCMGSLIFTHQTTSGGIHRKESRRCIHDMPNTQMIHTEVVIITTPAQGGSVPFDTAARQDAPEIELMAFQPVVDIMENTTTSKLPQYPNE